MNDYDPAFVGRVEIDIVGPCAEGFNELESRAHLVD